MPSKDSAQPRKRASARQALHDVARQTGTRRGPQPTDLRTILELTRLREYPWQFQLLGLTSSWLWGLQSNRRTTLQRRHASAVRKAAAAVRAFRERVLEPTVVADLRVMVPEAHLSLAILTLPALDATFAHLSDVLSAEAERPKASPRPPHRPRNIQIWWLLGELAKLHRLTYQEVATEIVTTIGPRLPRQEQIDLIGEYVDTRVAVEHVARRIAVQWSEVQKSMRHQESARDAT